MSKKKSVKFEELSEEAQQKYIDDFKMRLAMDECLFYEFYGEEPIEKKLKTLEEKYPLVVHTGPGRLYSGVRRMKAEKEMNIPIIMRSGFFISVASGKRANQMESYEWEEFYQDVCQELKESYPSLYEKLFNK